MIIRTDFPNEGIEIDHGDRDISAVYRNEYIEIAIGIDYSGELGYKRYADIALTVAEAQILCDWLHKELEVKDGRN